MVLVGESFLARLVGRFLTLLVGKPKPVGQTVSARNSGNSFGNWLASDAAKPDTKVFACSEDCSKDFCARMASPLDFATVEIIAISAATKDSLKFPHSWSAIKFSRTPPIEQIRPADFVAEQFETLEFDRALSERLAVVALANGPKALRARSAEMRSTIARPAPVIETRRVVKKRNIGQSTWAAYTGRTHSQSRRTSIAMSQSAQIIPLSNKAMPVKRGSAPLKSSGRGLARAA